MKNFKSRSLAKSAAEALGTGVKGVKCWWVSVMVGFLHLDVSKNRGILPPKWMVKIMENPIKMDDLGVPLFLETPTWMMGSHDKRKMRFQAL